MLLKLMLEAGSSGDPEPSIPVRPMYEFVSVPWPGWAEDKLRSCRGGATR